MRIRAQLRGGRSQTSDGGRLRVPEHSLPEHSLMSATGDPTDSLPERMALDLAIAVERERLEDRVRVLELEVVQLRQAISSILHTAAAAFDPTAP